MWNNAGTSRRTGEGDQHYGDVENACHSAGNAGDANSVVNGSGNAAESEVPEVVSVVEKEVDLMDKYVTESIKRLQACCESNAPETKKDKAPAAVAVARKKSYKKFKINERHRKNSRDRKSCDHYGNQDNLCDIHKCEKKKFYDPKDIRKYMLKKKTERLAKEKEEKSKKADEAAVLRKKLELTKMCSTKPMSSASKHVCDKVKTDVNIIKLPNNHETAQSTEIAEEAQKPEAITNLVTPAIQFNKNLTDHVKERLANFKASLPNDSKDAQNVLPNGKSSFSNKNANFAFDELDKASVLADISKTEKYFKKQFNDIINKCMSEAGKISSVEKHSANDNESLHGKQVSTRPANGDHKGIAHSSKSDNNPISEVKNLPIDEEILRSKNPYNFLNILKGKVNLLRNSSNDDISTNRFCEESLLSTAFASARSKSKDDTGKEKTENDKYIADIIKRRLKLASSIPLTAKLGELRAEEMENVKPTYRVKPGLALFGMSETPKRPNSEWAAKWNHRKSNETIEVQDMVSDVSGIKSLAASDYASAAEQLETTLTQETSGVFRTPLREHEDDERSNFESALRVEPLRVQDVSLSLPKSLADKSFTTDIKKAKLSTPLAEGENKRYSHLSFRSGFREQIGNSEAFQNPSSDFSSALSSDDLANLSISAVFMDIYDQMLKSEDEKLNQILQKIQHQKESLNKYLKSEVFSLELQKSIHVETKNEEKIKAIKKKQRAVLLKVMKNIEELDKMKTSVMETVKRRKTEILKQKSAMKEKRELLRPKYFSPKKKKVGDHRAYLVSKPMRNIFSEVTSTSNTSIAVENENVINGGLVNGYREDHESDELSEFAEKSNSGTVVGVTSNNSIQLKDTATSPVYFNTGISIRLDLDAEKLLHLKNSCAEVKIDSVKLAEPTTVRAEVRYEKEDKSNCAEKDELQRDQQPESKRTSIKIKRPLSPVMLPPSKKAAQIRRLSSSSEFTLASLNDTTDQSDVEFRISALQEQLRTRKLEAERLRKEEKQLRKEKLRAREQSLIKQLEAYDQYIQRVTKMLSDDKIFTDGVKPQIKQLPRKPWFGDQSSHYERRSTDDSEIENKELSTSADKESIIAAPNTQITYTDDVYAETNTDSEKQLRKADSGILVESEVTEPSEHVDSRASESRQVPVSEKGKVDAETERISHFSSKSESSIVERKSENVFLNTSKSMDNFLQLVNDIQSEIYSMSEQVYSSDFVEDIPEDVADTKSELSENVTNENNTSLSIEEILSDHQDVSDSEHRAGSGERMSTIDTDLGSVARVSEDDVLLNVRNISEIESLPMEIPTNGVSERKITESRVSETLDSVAEEIKSISVLEVTSQVDEKEMYIKFSSEENDNDAQPRELIKYESEGSSVPDVDEPVGKSDDIETVVETVEFSENNLDDVLTAENVQRNFDEVLKSLESFFNMKVLNAEETLKDVEESISKAVPKESAPEVTKPTIVVSAKIDVRPENFEETDVSESLEYDSMSMENSEGHKLKIELNIAESKESNESSHALSDDADGSNKNDKASGKELSVEEDRSVEEFLEDYSIPNLGLTTFIVNEDSKSEGELDGSVEIRTATPTPVNSEFESNTKSEKQINNEDLDRKITKDQTPFLQALRREQEALSGLMSEREDNDGGGLFTSDAEETRDGIVDTQSEKNDTDANEICGNARNSTQSNSKLDGKIDAPFLATKRLNNFENEWYDSRLYFEEERLREVEQIRLQQMRIEQEIQELQAQQRIPPYLYIREIPNKPPPPYTPPGSEKHSARIPNTETELRAVIVPTIKYVCNELEKGTNLDDIDQPSAESSDSGSGSENNEPSNDLSSYKTFIFDLTKEITRKLLKSSETPLCVPWEERRTRPKPAAAADLPKLVEDEILILYGYKPRIAKEKLIIQWSRKKRNDFVDDLLIKELHEEEAEWTNYEEDENAIKNQIAEGLFENVVEDTVRCLQEAFSKRSLAN